MGGCSIDTLMAARGFTAWRKAEEHNCFLTFGEFSQLCIALDTSHGFESTDVIDRLSKLFIFCSTRHALAYS